MQAANRDAASLNILAVSKGMPVARIRAAHALGQKDFGENYAKELEAKVIALGPGPHWHFIGVLQANKSKLVARHCDWLHSLDRLHLAQRLNAQRPATAAPLQVLLQVRLEDSAQSPGVPPGQLAPLAKEIRHMPRLKLRGLMLMPKAPLEKRQHLFERLRHQLEALRRGGLEQLDTLSMGSSGDMEAAIAAGATWVRIGTAFFGPRPGPGHLAAKIPTL